MNKQEEFPDWYCTLHIWTAAFLLATGAPSPRLDGERGKARFWFHDPEGDLAWKAENAFHTDAAVGLKSVFNAMRTLKDAMDEQFGPRR